MIILNRNLRNDGSHCCFVAIRSMLYAFAFLCSTAASVEIAVAQTETDPLSKAEVEAEIQVLRSKADDAEKSGQREQAIELLQRIVSLKSKLYGPASPELSFECRKLAELLRLTGDYAAQEVPLAVLLKIQIAAYGEADVERLLGDARIIRSRAKINSAIKGARIWLEMLDSGEDFSEWLWSFVGGAPIQNTWPDGAGRPTQTPESEAMTKALKARGFTFCGPVIVYAFMQAVGMVNDHGVECFRHGQVRARTGG